MALPVRVHRDKTSPARWDGFVELSRLADDLAGGRDGFLAPKQFGTEVRDTDDAYVVELRVPHMKKRDIDVSVAGRRLIITGAHTQRSGILRRTRRVEQFRYDVDLPGQVAEDGVRANLDGDVLTVTVPKAASERRRRIEVR